MFQVLSSGRDRDLCGCLAHRIDRLGSLRCYGLHEPGIGGELLGKHQSAAQLGPCGRVVLQQAEQLVEPLGPIRSARAAPRTAAPPRRCRRGAPPRGDHSGRTGTPVRRSSRPRSSRRPGRAPRPRRPSCTRTRARRSPRPPPTRRCCGPRSASPPARPGAVARRSPHTAPYCRRSPHQPRRRAGRAPVGRRGARPTAPCRHSRWPARRA